MVCFFRNPNIKTVLSITSCLVFSAASAVPNDVPVKEIFFFNEEAKFFSDIQSLIADVEYFKKSGNKDGIFKKVVEIKHRVECFLNKSINFEQCFQDVENQLKKSGTELPKNWAKQFKDAVKKHDAKKRSYVEYIESFDGLSEIPNVALDEWEFLLQSNKQQTSTDDIPLTVTFFVTMALAGVFLMFVPIPICKVYGEKLMYTGFTGAGVEIARYKQNHGKKALVG